MDIKIETKVINTAQIGSATVSLESDKALNQNEFLKILKSKVSLAVVSKDHEDVMFYKKDCTGAEDGFLLLFTVPYQKSKCDSKLYGKKARELFDKIVYKKV